VGDDDVAQTPGRRSSGEGSTDVSLVGRLLTSTSRAQPFLFGVGFVAPLVAQMLESALPGEAHGHWPMVVGLAIGGSWGAIANSRGRWI
jgi:hypothetical protein